MDGIAPNKSAAIWGGLVESADERTPCRAERRGTVVRMNRRTPDRPQLNAELAVPLRRSGTWHPDMIGACLMHVFDRLHDTGELESAGFIGQVLVEAPRGGDPKTIADTVGAERSTVRRIGRAADGPERP
ncbi:hypothetical protein [Candidatus Poriferisodalis sp.]|uniref:hypothetical protein n=1 Tax=Candidatus Poriferisodalis sp. TaxID=3101277 RepID=UPI003B52110F